ncbi:MAG: 50S ribosomal protein L4 [Oscillospiraceae bacterium]|jgi:large subunit ribosomal protein L4|nr:50S ribosomal protein L4 [Oscillospiraceae bacterium]
MAKLNVVDMTGKAVSTIELSDTVFGIEPNVSIMHTVVKAYLANQRQGTHSARNRSEVTGGGRKPYRQKGTGRARQGSIRAVQWKGGGVAFPVKPRDYRVSVNKKVRALAMCSALSAKVADGDVVVVDNITMDEYKTKNVVKMLEALGADRKALIVMDEKNDFVVRSAANIPGVKTALTNTINVYDILNGGKFIVSADAIKKIEEVYAK